MDEVIMCEVFIFVLRTVLLSDSSSLFHNNFVFHNEAVWGNAIVSCTIAITFGCIILYMESMYCFERDDEASRTVNFGLISHR